MIHKFCLKQKRVIEVLNVFFFIIERLKNNNIKTGYQGYPNALQTELGCSQINCTNIDQNTVSATHQRLTHVI